MTRPNYLVLSVCPCPSRPHHPHHRSLNTAPSSPEPFIDRQYNLKPILLHLYYWLHCFVILRLHRLPYFSIQSLPDCSINRKKHRLRDTASTPAAPPSAVAPTFSTPGPPSTAPPSLLSPLPASSVAPPSPPLSSHHHHHACRAHRTGQRRQVWPGALQVPAKRNVLLPGPDHRGRDPAGDRGRRPPVRLAGDLPSLCLLPALLDGHPHPGQPSLHSLGDEGRYQPRQLHRVQIVPDCLSHSRSYHTGDEEI